MPRCRRPPAAPPELVGDLDDETRVINVPWPARDFLERIYVSPYAEKWYRDVVVSVMERFAPDLIDRLTWSHMRGVPVY